MNINDLKAAGEFAQNFGCSGINVRKNVKKLKEKLDEKAIIKTKAQNLNLFQY